MADEKTARAAPLLSKQQKEWQRRHMTLTKARRPGPKKITAADAAIVPEWKILLDEKRKEKAEKAERDGKEQWARENPVLAAIAWRKAIIDAVVKMRMVAESQRGENDLLAYAEPIGPWIPGGRDACGRWTRYGMYSGGYRCVGRRQE